MFVYLLLSLVYHFVPLSGNPAKNLAREGSIRRVYRAPMKNFFREGASDWGFRDGDTVWEWNAIESGNYYPSEETEGLPENAEGAPPEGFYNLEISKSVELVFDPKEEALVPAMEVSKKNRTEVENSQRNSLLLLSSSTRKSLCEIFEKFEKEAKGSRITDAKNYQTGRFKLHFRKGRGF